MGENDRPMACKEPPWGWGRKLSPWERTQLYTFDLAERLANAKAEVDRREAEKKDRGRRTPANPNQ